MVVTGDSWLGFKEAIKLYTVSELSWVKEDELQITGKSWRKMHFMSAERNFICSWRELNMKVFMILIFIIGSVMKQCFTR